LTGSKFAGYAHGRLLWNGLTMLLRQRWKLARAMAEAERPPADFCFGTESVSVPSPVKQRRCANSIRAAQPFLTVAALRYYPGLRWGICLRHLQEIDMRKIAFLIAVLGTILLPVLGTVPGHAQATRTWVSGVGDDANPCSRTAPCLTFAGAITKTAAGGEIDNLDAGGFGTLTISKSITIDGGGGGVASVMASGNAGIIVSAGATDIVTIRNVQLQGDLGNGSSPGTAGS
jgi:hypothetical protein